MPRKSTPTLAQAAAEYMSVRSANLAPTTVANETSVIQCFVRGMGEEKRCHVVTARDVEIWFATESRRQQASSYNKIRSRVGAFIGFLRRRGWIDVDLMAEIGSRKVMKKDRMRLTPSDLLDLPNHATNERDQALLVIASNTALRAGSIVTIRIGDVDLAGGTIRVTVHKSQIEDHVPITEELNAELRSWFRCYEDEAGPLQGDWYLIPRRQPGGGTVRDERGHWVGGLKMWTVGSLVPNAVVRNPAEIVQRALVAQGHHIGPGEGVHTVRRSVARAYFDARVAEGYDAALRSTSALLHHSSTQVTETYLGLTHERLGRDRALKGKPFLSAMVKPIADVAELPNKQVS